MRNLAPAPYNNLYIVDADAWDGYPTHRADLMGYLKAQNITTTRPFSRTWAIVSAPLPT